jgi:hypothetical protein
LKISRSKLFSKALDLDISKLLVDRSGFRD